MKRIDYLVEVEGDDTKDEFVYNIRSALKLAKEWSKKYGRAIYIQKFRDEIPADFDTPSHWVVKPTGEVVAH